MYEPERIWDEYVPAEQQSAARAAFFHATDEFGSTVAALNGHSVKPMHSGAIVRQAIWRPGMTVEEIGAMDPLSGGPINPGAWDSSARLDDMDAMGIDAAVLCPTLFNEYLPLVANPETAAVLARAYNDWVKDLCQAAPERLVPVAVLPLQNALLARRELARVGELGFKAALLRPMFYAVAIDRPSLGRALAAQGGGAGSVGPALADGQEAIYLDDPYYRGVWEELASRDMVACIHASPGSTNPNGVSAGTFIERVARTLNIGHRVAETVASLRDNATFLTAACYHGLLEDYPTLRLALLHGSASMTPLTLEKSETYLWLSLQGGRMFTQKPVSLEPEEVFAAHPAAVSFPSWEISVGRLAAKVDYIGTKAAWGSRYPQHDTAGPQAAIDMLRAHLSTTTWSAVLWQATPRLCSHSRARRQYRPERRPPAPAKRAALRRPSTAENTIRVYDRPYMLAALAPDDPPPVIAVSATFGGGGHSEGDWGRRGEVGR